MRVLFDQGTPAPLRASLVEHAVFTALERGWDRLSDRDLLDRAEADGFDVLVTTDQNLRYQQALAGRRLYILVLRTTDWRRIQKRVQAVSAAVSELRPGAYVELAFPRT